MAKNPPTEIATARSLSTAPAICASLPAPYARQPMAVASTAHASARVTGVANSNEKTTPSGVSMLSDDALGAFIQALSFPPRPSKEQAKCRQFANTDGDLERVGKHRLVVLRNESLQNAGPDQQGGGAEGDGEQVRGHAAKPVGTRSPAAPAD